jgi:hypothetical protein
MNKTFSNKRYYLAVGIVFAIAVIFAFGQANAAVSYPGPVQSGTPMAVNIPATVNTPLVATSHFVLIDNFEYWETPLNQGWHAHEPAFPGGYPVWGMNIGPGQLATVLDFQEGSRVLEVFYPSNVLVPNMQKYMASYLIGTTLPVEYSVLGLKMRAPVAIENFDQYEIIAVCNGGLVEVHLTTKASGDCGANCPVAVPEATAKMNTGLVPFNPAASPVLIEVNIGREASDGSWHMIRVDLAQVFANLGGTFETLTGIVLRGNQFRCDDIKVLTAAGNARIAKDLYLFHINHIFTQIFDPVGFRRYVFASDPVADAILPAGGNFGNTQVMAMATGQTLAGVNYSFWEATAMPAIAGVDPAMSDTAYAAAVAAYEATLTDITLKDVRRAAIQAGGGDITIGLGAGGVDITVDARLVYPLDVPMLIDPVMAEGPVTSDGGFNMLSFVASIGGAHELGTGANISAPVPTTEPLPYYPLYKVASTTSGNPYLTSQEIQTVAMSLYYGGYDAWPTVSIIAVPPQQVMENMVVTVVCSDGISEDIESFMVETVNYPVTNHPPVIEDIDDQIFYVDSGPQAYQINATDADSFTFSSAVQFSNDIEQLIYTAYLEGYASYMYGPYTESLINQKTGLISFDPISEGAYQMIVTVRDPKGAEAYGAFTIFCVNDSGWLNHPPVLLRDWEHPMIGRQGDELVLDFSGVVDPDGEPLYFSCNIGSIGYVNGVAVWTFQTEFPGTYMVEIVAYDTSGGYLVIPQEVIITPYWSM